MRKDPSVISLAIKNEALRLGFSACGFSKADYLEEDAFRLKNWLEEGRHGSMQYMENHFDKRCDPAKLVEGSKSVISLLLNYYTDKTQKDPQAPVISKYAYGVDYHFVMKEKMYKLFEFINANYGPVPGRVFVDSAPVLDRAWAYRAGLGWVGKNSNLINRHLGSFFFIGEIILDLELEYNRVPENDFCGACSACIEACPTDAILPGKVLDANKCISYLTIENKSDIPVEFKGMLQNRAFGCDICQDVCPWNRKAIQHDVPEFEPSEELLELSKDEWNNMDRATFNRLFKDSPVIRAGYDGLMRNVRFLDGTS